MDIREASVLSGKKLERHPWELARSEVIQKLLQRFASDIIDRGGIILDIGCGDSFVTQELATRYPNTRVIGIDQALDPQMIQEVAPGASVPNLEIYQSLDQVPGDRESIEILLFLDVLEHIENDVLFLESVLSNALVNRIATVLITVPAFQWLFSAHDHFLSHFRRYNHRRLLQVAHQAQVNTIHYGYFFSSLLLLRSLSVILEKIQVISPRPVTGVSKWKGYGLLDLFLKRLLVYEFNISQTFHKLNFLLPGLSCYIIGRKQGL